MGKSLAKKLADIMAEVGHVPKRGHNAYHHYDYVRASDILDAVREKMAKAGIAVIPSILSASTEAQGDGKLTSLWLEYTLIDSETGETVKASMPGQGWDKGDKGVYKAITGSMKYFVTALFMVSSGDDPEADTKADIAVEGSTPKGAPEATGPNTWRGLPVLAKGDKRFVVLRGLADDIAEKENKKKKKYLVFSVYPNWPQTEPKFSVFSHNKKDHADVWGLKYKHVYVNCELSGDYLNYESGQIDARGDMRDEVPPPTDDSFFNNLGDQLP
jgi:hypothetical protein